MNFSDALQEIRLGKKVTRPGWNGRGMHVALQEPDPESMNTLPYIYIITASRDRVPWTVSQTDLLASDWVVVV